VYYWPIVRRQSPGSACSAQAVPFEWKTRRRQHPHPHPHSVGNLRPREQYQRSETALFHCSYRTGHGRKVRSRCFYSKFFIISTFLGVRKDFILSLYKYMASLTEIANKIEGATVLFIPPENCGEPEHACKDKELCQRLEGQLCHPAGLHITSRSSSLPGPLDTTN